MKKRIAIVASITALACILIGCSSCDIGGKQSFGIGFNDESYVWESFIFTTNQVHEVK